MNQVVVKGGIPLQGTVNISGSKHSALPILAALLLARGIVNINNIPNIVDVEHMLSIVKSHNVKANRLNAYTLRFEIDEVRVSIEELWRIEKLRSSVLLLGSLLVRTGNVSIPYPGGDKLGLRPMNEFFYVLEQFGISFRSDVRGIKAKLKGSLQQDRDIHLVTELFPMMGNNRTALALILAWANNGRTIIRNALILPEIVELCDFLELISNGLVTIDGIGSKTISVCSPGIKAIHKKNCHVEITINHDKCEYAFWIAASSLTHGDITLSFPFGNMELRNTLRKVRTKILNQANIPLQVIGNNLFRVNCTQGEHYPVSFELNAPYHEKNGVAFDATPLLATILFKANGSGYFRCGRFGTERAKWAVGLEQIGAKYEIESDGTLRVTGVNRLYAEDEVFFHGTDIRGASALLLLALATEGHHVVFNGLSHIQRGMENPIGKLTSLGASLFIKNQEINA